MAKREAFAELQNIQASHSNYGAQCDVKMVTEPVDMGLYEKLVAKGKETAAEGNLEESLEAFKAAYKIKETEKILGRINKIERLMEELKDEEDEDFVELDNGLIIFRKLVERLYPHQVEGIKWIYNLFKDRKKGGILADDMGLGKTIQVIAALSAMFDMEVINHVLLVLPLSLIPNWTREFEKWAPGIKTKCFHGTTRERTSALQYCQRKGGVCMTTYGLVQTQWEQLGQTKYRSEFVWDYIILDEGHKIKNPTKTTKSLHSIPSKNRLILTGTPIQNNLRELWALFDWIMQGTLLGTQKTFRSEYENPITRARQRGASGADIHLGNYMAESLRKIVDPYIMRRTKGSVSAVKPEGSTVDKSQMGDSVKKPSFPKLKKKNDFVIWTYLSDVQENIYRDFLQQESIKELLASKRSPLVQLNVLKKICDHPRLLSRRACHGLGLEANESIVEEEIDSERFKECAANRIDNISDETLIKESGKLQFLIELLVMLKEEGHRTLIFSLSRKVLNIIQRILLNKRFKVMRLDGTITKLSERELRVNKFQNDSSYEVFLLTTQVGGVGLTLTAADRVVIFDPSWNPATDAQAVDRIYRIGQEKNVVVYRLITCGTVEEKIYRRQIFKDSIIKQSTGDNKDPYRYFTNQELRELFQLESTTDSVTQRQLQELHSEQRCLDPKLDEHLARIHMLPMFGVSDHDLMFSQAPDDVDPEMIDEHRESIKDKVASARVRVEAEARGFTGTERAESRWGEFETKPTVSQPKIPETEPVYPVEGLYDEIKSLQLVEEAVDKIFENNASFTEEKSEDSRIRDARLSNPFMRHGVDDDKDDKSILVADSPAKEESRVTEDSAIEIEESFVSNSVVKSTSNTPSKSLFETDISCIQQSNQDAVVSPAVGRDVFKTNSPETSHNSVNETTEQFETTNDSEIDDEISRLELQLANESREEMDRSGTVDDTADTGISDYLDDNVESLLEEALNESAGKSNLAGESDAGRLGEKIQNLTRGSMAESEQSMDELVLDGSEQSGDDGVLDETNSEDESMLKRYSLNADVSADKSPADKEDPEDLPDYDECLYGDGSDSEKRPVESDIRPVSSETRPSDSEMQPVESDTRQVESETRPVDSDIDSDTQSVNSNTRSLDSDGPTGDVTDDERPRSEIDRRSDDDFLADDSDDEVVHKVRGKNSWTISDSSDSEKDESFQTAPYDNSRTPGTFFTPAPNKGKARRRSSAAPLRSLDLSDDSAVADDTYREHNRTSVGTVGSMKLELSLQSDDDIF